MKSIETVSNIMKKKIVNQMLCKKMCESGYVRRGIMKHRTSWKNFTIQCQAELKILLKQRDVKRNIDLMM